LAELDALWHAQTASIVVEPGTDAAVRLGKRAVAAAAVPVADRAESDVSADGRQMVELHYTDLNILADELAGYGPEVFVRSPPALRDAVLLRLRLVRDSHAPLSEESR
jgi:proteasome accessory factor B